MRSVKGGNEDCSQLQTQDRSDQRAVSESMYASLPKQGVGRREIEKVRNIEREREREIYIYIIYIYKYIYIYIYLHIYIYI